MSPYVTQDFGLVAYLYSIGHMPTITQMTPTRRQFAFQADVAKDVTAYYGHATVEARRLVAAMKTVKSMMYDSQPTPTTTTEAPTHAYTSTNPK